MRTGVLGFGVPYGVLASVGLEPVDVTLRQARAGTAADRYIECFMDPFAVSVLRGLAAGDFDDLGALIFLRESPGAMIACQYAFELARRGVIPKSAPVPVMLNILPADHPAADRFNRAELARLVEVLTALGWVPDEGVKAPSERFDALLAAQAEGVVSGADAFDIRAGRRDEPRPHRAQGPRLALLGAPFGNSVLHAALDRIGHLVLDQQALDQACAARGRGLDAALTAQAANPFAARQPKPLYLPGIAAALTEHRIDRVVWQVDPHDDLWGWLMPQVRDLCAGQGVGFADLGFLPRWPTPGDIVIGKGV
ncbi:hypothetical protein [Maritimibacter sp. DP1N21-5]|uniref:hypothetical protein n=1 Tax=Maritimibacter sp. DP1N21-5 TaxID=2836867 RepID=UPI001C4403A8|nr:hypothetical protein [Maritimibacter sp. DP1N21-5]MBV7407389.1 hypothetical protein [Maritimibacter sp. DP1N21-5]